MRVKFNDILELVQYAEKEKIDECSIYVTDGPDPLLKVSFTDQENRDCLITISNSSFGRKPMLTKTMQLISRLPNNKEKK